jgi:hypothetical protein
MSYKRFGDEAQPDVDLPPVASPASRLDPDRYALLKKPPAELQSTLKNEFGASIRKPSK